MYVEPSCCLYSVDKKDSQTHHSFLHTSLKGVDMCSRIVIVGKMEEQKHKDRCTYTEGRIRIRQLSTKRAGGQSITASHGPMRKTP